MPLLETIITGLATATVKGAIKIWLNDNLIAEEIGVSIADIIGKKTQIITERREATRQFETIIDNVATSMNDMLEMQGHNVSKNRLEIICNAASETISNSPINAELLAQHNLDPHYLTEYFLSRKGKDGGNPLINSPKEEILVYESLLSDAAQHIIDISNQLPKFEEKIFSELLKRQDYLISIVKPMLDELKRIRIGSVTHEMEDRNFNVVACPRIYVHPVKLI